MASFTVGAVEFDRRRPSDFQEFINIAKGRSIVSAADWGADRLELGLSGGVMLRLFTTIPTEVNLVTTMNPGELPPLLVEFGDLPQRVPLSVIEDKLRGFRTLHAIYYLAESDRTTELEDYLSSTPEGDIERDLIPDEERLQIESLSYGSWTLALWAKTTKAFKAVSSVAGLVFERGREAYLRRLEAESKMLENQADREGIHAARESFELGKTQLDYLLDVSDRMHAPEIKERLRLRVLESVDSLTLGDRNDAHARNRLPGPH
jgi:hypothetical protein